MKLLYTTGFICLTTILLLTACRKDQDIYGSNPPVTTEPEIIVNGSLSGLVTDDNNQAVVDATVSIGTNFIQTDENGYFSFEDVAINTKGSLVRVRKEGYFYNAKFVDSRLNKQNYTKIKMIPKSLTGSFSANTGGVISTDDNARIQFLPNSIQQENGEVYTGDVNVYATWIDPTAADLYERMPGDLRAVNIEGNQQQLTTYGMIGVELESESGEPLNIAESQTATIELPIPEALVSSAPSTIPLWHFNEFSGYWEEEGSATLDGNKYIGTVNHFSFWNCDIANDFVNIDGMVTNQVGTPLEGLVVLIREVAGGVNRGDVTDEEGVYGGAVPMNTDLVLSIQDNCNDEIYITPIGPFVEDTTIPTITVSTTDNFVTITGTLVDCNNNPVSNGYIVVNLGDISTTLPVDGNGNFNELVSICDVFTAEIIGVDLVNFTTSDPIIQSVSKITTLNVGNIQACEAIEEFMNYSIAGITVNDDDPTARATSLNLDPGYLIIDGRNPETNNGFPYIKMSIKATTTGTFEVGEGESGILAGYINSTPMSIGINCDENCNLPVTVTTYEGIGGYVIGSFAGELENTLGVLDSISGSFKILIE